MKQLIGYIAVFLTFAGYVPYILDTLKGKTKPHVYTWFMWGSITAIAFALQIQGGAGVGALVTLAAAIVCGFVFLLGLRNGNKDIALIDKVCLLLGTLALVLWLFAKQPVLSVIILSMADILGFIPTIRKSWKKPYEETLFSYQMNTFRFILALVALETYTIVTILYPLTWVIANGLFSIFLIVRRKQVKPSTQ